MIRPSLLTITDANGALAGRRRHFVYVPGIRPEPSAFDPLRQRLEREAKVRSFPVAHYGFTYPYQEHMEMNGAALAMELTRIGATDRSVTLFGHSMGGLICRLAILDRTPAYKLVKRVIMFGTPNHGAVRASSLMLPLLWIAHEAAVKIEGYWTRSRGILELTEVHKVFQDPLKRRAQADGIEYITVPGTCFNESRHQLDFDGLTTMMQALGVATLLLRHAYSPSLPHDGVVERRSVDLLPAQAGRRSEKEGSYTHFSDPKIEYAHMHLMACDRLDHLTVHRDEEILELVAEMVFRDKLNELACTKFARDIWPFL